MSLANRLNAYLKADRQWKRPHRIAHAKRELHLAKVLAAHDPTEHNHNEVAFWANVLAANQWRPFRVQAKNS